MDDLSNNRQRIDQTLSGALAGGDLSASGIVDRAMASAIQGRGRRVMAGAGCLMLLIASAWGYWHWGSPDKPIDTAVAVSPSGTSQDQTAGDSPVDDSAAPDDRGPTGDIPTGDPTGDQQDNIRPKQAPAAPPAAADENQKNNPADDDQADPVAPWQREDQLGGPPRKAEDISFTDLFELGQTPRAADLQEWFSSVEGKPHTFSERDIDRRKCGAIDGWVRLRAPWPDDAVLRLALADHFRLKIHLYDGTTGVVLQYHHHRGMSWTAYETSGRAIDTVPARFALAATDEGRNYRTYYHASPRGGGTFALRWHNGQIVLSRGDVRLLSAKLHRPPVEVVFEGHAKFRGLAMVRSLPLPETESARPSVVRIGRLADADWTTRLPSEAKLERHSDGSIELKSAAAKEPAFATLTVPQSGLYEVVFKVDAATPGTAVVLADEQGKPIVAAKFFKERRTGRKIIALASVRERHDEVTLDPNSGPVAYVGGPTWIRLVFGCGNVKCWQSTDGVHWARTCRPMSGLTGPWSSIGLFCMAGRERAIRLSQVEFRELSALTALAPEDLRKQAPTLIRQTTYPDWLVGVLRSQPVGVSPALWRRGCAIRRLSVGTSDQLGSLLLDHLVDDAMLQDRPAKDRLDVLDDAALLAHTTLHQTSALRFAARYRQLGERLYLQRHRRALSLVRRRQMSAAIWSKAPLPVSFRSLSRLQLLDTTAAGRWDEVSQLCREIRFFGHRWRTDRNADPIVQWAAALAMRNRPRGEGRSLLGFDDLWRDPLIEQLSKDSYHVMAEFQASLAGKDYHDAAEVIASAGAELVERTGPASLLPDANDDRLLVSLPVAVVLAMGDHPPLRGAMNKRFGPLAQLRVRRAMASGNVATIEAATLQFHGTEAAAEAHLWLGNRALAVGEFSRAVAHYRQASASTSGTIHPEAAARLRLAAALMGRDLGQKPSGPVQLGRVRLSVTQFEQMVEQARTRHEKSSDQDGFGSTVNDGGRGSDTRYLHHDSTQTAMRPSGFAVTRRAVFDAGQVDRPKTVPRDRRRRPRDPLATQLAVVSTSGLMIVHSGYVTAAFDRQSGDRRWQTVLPGPRASPGSWPVEPKRPLIVGNKIFVRFLSNTGPKLACLSLDSGNIIWQTKLSSKEIVASDPMWIQDELHAIAVERTERRSTLMFTSYDLETGETLRRRPMVHLRDSWWEHAVCRTVKAGDTVIVTLGGAVICCDLSGQVRWARRQTFVPSTVDANSVVEFSNRPLIYDGKLYVAQPGVRSIECLDPSTGRRRWAREDATLYRLCGIAEGLLVVRTATAVEGLNPSDGRRIWRQPMGRAADGSAEGRLKVVACGGPGGILCSYHEEAGLRRPENQRRAHLIWLDPKTGSPTAQWTFDSLHDNDPRIGPVIVSGDRSWVFFGRGDSSSSKELFELAAEGDPLPSLAAVSMIRRTQWAGPIDLQFAVAVATRLPLWLVVSGGSPSSNRPLVDHGGQKDVLATTVAGNVAVVFARRLTIPHGDRPDSAAARLNIKVGHQPGQSWPLKIAIGSRVVLETIIDDKTSRNGWRELDIDLSSFSGKNLWVTVSQQKAISGNPTALWQRLELIQ